MGTGKGGVDQFPGIGMARMDRHMGEPLVDIDHAVDVVEIEPRVDALGEHVERQGDDIDIAGPLAVAEQGTFDPFAAGHQGQLGGRHGTAPVIMGMQTDDGAIATSNGRQNHSIWSA